MEDELELQDSQPAGEEVAAEEPAELSDPYEDPGVSAEQLAEQNKRLYARAKKAEEENKALKAQKSSEARETKTEQTNPSYATKEDIERVELAAKGYAEDEINFIMRNGGKQALADEMVLSAIEARRAKNRSEDATPTSSPKSPQYKRYTKEELEAMSVEELEKILPHA